MTLLEETIAVIQSEGGSVDEVKWVGSSDGTYAISWDEFCEIAKINYDDGYGGQEIAEDLVVVGTNWWMTRGEYDGSEWWEFHTKPKIGKKPKKFTKVKVKGWGWSYLHNMNTEED